MKVTMQVLGYIINLSIKVELGVVIGKAGSNIKEENAFNHVAGYALALDLTARDIQVTAMYFLRYLYIIFRMRLRSPAFPGLMLKGMIRFALLGT